MLRWKEGGREVKGLGRGLPNEMSEQLRGEGSECEKGDDCKGRGEKKRASKQVGVGSRESDDVLSMCYRGEKRETRRGKKSEGVGEAGIKE